MAPAFSPRTWLLLSPGGHGGLARLRGDERRAGRGGRERSRREKPDLIKLMITGGVLGCKEKRRAGRAENAAGVRPRGVRRGRTGSACPLRRMSKVPRACAWRSKTAWIRSSTARSRTRKFCAFSRRGAAQVATLSAVVPYARFDCAVSKATEMEQYNGEVVLEGIIECAKACLAAGIPVGLGTDMGRPYITHYDMWREVRYFHTFCGVSNAFAPHTATLGNAKIAGIDGLTGSLTPGKSADLVVTAGNPLEDLEAPRQCPW